MPEVINGTAKLKCDECEYLVCLDSQGNPFFFCRFLHIPLENGYAMQHHSQFCYSNVEKVMLPTDIARADGDIRYVPTADKSFCGMAHESRYNWVLNAFDLADKVVLDSGCGSGYGTYLLAGKAKAVYGIDYSPEAIKYAQSKYAALNLKFFVANACSRTEVGKVIDDKPVDIVCSFDVIEHIERYFDYLANIRSVLKKDGTLVIGCPNRLQLFKWSRHWNPYHFQEFSPYQLEKVLSLYFKDVTLVAQDFRDPIKREATRIAQYGQATSSAILSIAALVKAIPGPLFNAVRRIYLGTMHKTVDIDISDIEFKVKPSRETLEQAFGLVAICRLPKQGANE